MPYLTSLASFLQSVFLIWEATTSSVATSSLDTRSYTDVDTGMSFKGHVSTLGYRFGMMMPQQPTTDFLAQLVSPLVDGAGWGGIGFRGWMNGPLLLVTWSDGDKVMTAARVAHNYTTSGVLPYTASPISLAPIPQGAFVNSTHVSSTFLCRGCINSDSFDPSRADGANPSHDGDDDDVFFSYAFSQAAVETPSNIDTNLSGHTGQGAGYGTFKVVLSDAKSDEYDKYAAMAVDSDSEQQQPGEQPSTSTSSATIASCSRSTHAAKTAGTLTTVIPIPPAAATTTTDADHGGRDACWKSECEMPNGPDMSHRELSSSEFVALVLVGVVYLVHVFLP